MPADYKIAVQEIDNVLNDGKALRVSGMGEPTFTQLVSLYASAIDRLAPTGSQYVKEKELARSKYPPGQLVSHPGLKKDVADALEGILNALRQDYAAGRMRTIQERVRSDVFSDFLEMAEYLIEDEGLKDPAAVLASGVLEQHLRKLCDKHSVTVPAKATIDPMNNELAKANIYGKNEQKQILAWAGIRNSAAHAKYHEYTADQVKLMIQGIRLFLTTYPA